MSDRVVNKKNDQGSHVNTLVKCNNTLSYPKLGNNSTIDSINMNCLNSFSVPFHLASTDLDEADLFLAISFKGKYNDFQGNTEQSFLFMFFFKTRSHYAAQAGLELIILLPSAS
jgi:hypothetical protein